MTSSANDEDVLADLLATALEAADHGTEPDLALICGEREDLLPELAAALGIRDGLPGLHDRAGAADELTGRVLQSRYQLEEAIGQGAVGTVFRARDLQLQRDVAIKLLHHGLFSSPDVEARFRREAEVLAQHEHPHVVRIYDQGMDVDGTAYLVTELLRGKSLAAVLEAARERMPDGPDPARFGSSQWLRELLPEAKLERSYLRQLVVWMRQLADGLMAAHAQGVFHRDVKPSNIFIRADGTAVLLDFGIAARDGDAAMTLPHAIVGTPCYMAPEQAAGRPEPRPSIDVYGLTATLYHLLTLVPPHAGDLQNVLVAVRTTDPTPAARIHKGLPRDLQAILDCGLEHDLGRRYADIGELGADLDAFLDHRPVSVRPLGAVQRFGRSCRRRPARTTSYLLATGLAAALVLVLPLWAAVELHAATAEAETLRAHLPGDLCIEGRPEERGLVPMAERAVVIAELDRLLELEPNDLSTRMLRAGERLDSGDAVAAAADFAELRRRADSDYLRAVAARYEALAATGGKSADLDLEGLPEPTGQTDFFIAGFHALRARDCDRAEALLTQCVEYIPARDLRLLASLGSKRPNVERLMAEAGWLEGHYGRSTARTRHVMSFAMIMMRKYDDAIAYCLESLELRPDRHGPWNNLGLAYLRTGQHELALAACEQAVAIRPWFPNSLGNLAQVQRELGQFAKAEATARKIGDVSYREHELGNLMAARSVAAGAECDDVDRIKFASAAKRHFETAWEQDAETTRNPGHRTLPWAIAYADAMANPDRKVAIIHFLDRMRRNAANAQQIANAAGQLKGIPIDDELRDELRLFLLEIATTLAPGKDIIKRGRDDLRQRLRNSK